MVAFDIDVHCKHCRGRVPRGERLPVAEITDEDGIVHRGCADDYRRKCAEDGAEFAAEAFDDWFTETFGAGAPYSALRAPGARR